MSTATASPARPAAAGPGRAPSSPSLAQAAGLVAGREIRARLRSKAFLISTGILLLLVLGGIIASNLIGANAGPTKVAVVGQAQQLLDGQKGLAVTDAADRAAAEKLVESGEVDAAIVPDATSPTKLTIVANDEAPGSLVQQLSVTPKVTLLDPDAKDGNLRYLVALAFGIVFFSAAMTFGQTIAQSVVEEKSTRVIEILVAAVPARALMAGKVLGSSVLAFGQIALIAAAGVVGLTVTGQTEILQLLGAPLVWFVVFFVFGFVLLASLFAATGAMVSRQEDIGSTTTPVTMLVMLPYFAIVFFNSNALVVSVMSYVPFSAAIGMPLRLFLGDAQWWEPLIALVVLIASTLVVLAIGSRIYENSLLKLGARVEWKDALRK
ncbi:ABC transporter permease [Schumannella luteola]|uniref:ABC-2 type transport system permease protein n=1 Tax=Schumannella luteola TaxID=472059 RepID=A0A852Y7B7_9MICO|nr:ABC-2 type transport system permease protein [Schumannella luteola]TPX02160.1 ABC transporter permease [Schumannella luteola]